MGPRRGSRPAHHRRRQPRRRIEPGTIPAQRLVGTVDVLLEVDEIAFEITLRRVDPRTPAYAPRGVGRDHLDTAVLMGHPDLGDHTRLARGMTLGRTLPVVQETNRVDTRVQRGRDVERLVVLRVREAVRLALRQT